MPQGQYTSMGATYANQILQLGDQGFANWLLETFGGPEINLKGDYFQYPDNVVGTFDEIMGLVVEEFEDDVLRVGAKGVRLALSNLDPQSNPEGRETVLKLAYLFHPA